DRALPGSLRDAQQLHPAQRQLPSEEGGDPRMAPKSGTENPGLMPPAASLAEVRRDIEEYPGRFEFFQAVRLLLRMFNQREMPGGFTSASREALRFRVHNTLAFPTSQIESIDWD